VGRKRVVKSSLLFGVKTQKKSRWKVKRLRFFEAESFFATQSRMTGLTDVVGQRVGFEPFYFRKTVGFALVRSKDLASIPYVRSKPYVRPAGAGRRTYPYHL